MSNKVTKMDNFKSIVAVLKDAGKDELVAVMEHEMELLAKKNANKSNTPTANQKQNAEIGELVPTLLEADKWYRLSEIKEMIPALANSNGTQRIAVICNKLVEAKILSRKVEKRVIYYSLYKSEDSE